MPVLLSAIALMCLVVGCAEETQTEDALIKVGTDGLSSVFIAMTDSPFEQGTAELDPETAEELFVSSQHLTVTGITPGNYVALLEIDGAEGAFEIADLRPKTTAIIFVRPEGKRLRLVSHRRFTSRFDDTGSAEWIAEEL